MSKVHIIAEIGINHNGDLDIAKKLIRLAAVAGCDSVKFQKRNPDVCVPEHQKNVMRDTPWGTMTYLDYKYKVEFGKEEYDEIDRYCKENDIQWSASPWDLDSLEFLMQYDLPYIKLPSAHLTNTELLKACRETGKDIILSTGMSTVDEIDEAVKVFAWPPPQNKLTLLHCNSTYPAPIEELNLNCIQTLRERYSGDDYPQIDIGYSGHEFRLGTSVATVMMGATVIERHITLDRTMWGSDHMASVEPQGLIKLVRGIRELEAALGDGVIGVTEGEKPVRKKLRGV